MRIARASASGGGRIGGERLLEEARNVAVAVVRRYFSSSVLRERASAGSSRRSCWSISIESLFSPVRFRRAAGLRRSSSARLAAGAARWRRRISASFLAVARPGENRVEPLERRLGARGVWRERARGSFARRGCPRGRRRRRWTPGTGAQRRQAAETSSLAALARTTRTRTRAHSPARHGPRLREASSTTSGANCPFASAETSASRTSSSRSSLDSKVGGEAIGPPGARRGGSRCMAPRRGAAEFGNARWLPEYQSRGDRVISRQRIRRGYTRAPFSKPRPDTVHTAAARVARHTARVARHMAPSLDIWRASPDIRRTSPDIRRASPDIRRASPDIRRASPDIRRASQDIRRTSQDIRRTSQDIRRTSLDITASVARHTASVAGYTASVAGYTASVAGYTACVARHVARAARSQSCVARQLSFSSCRPTARRRDDAARRATPTQGLFGTPAGSTPRDYRRPWPT